MPCPRRPIADRLWEKVDFNGPVVRGELGHCWLFAGADNGTGYGLLGEEGRRGNVLVHRLAWRLAEGEIPDGLFVLHRCDQRRCVRRSHLWLGTHKENMRDMAEKGRAGYRNHPDSYPRRPGELGHHILTEVQVRAIRVRVAAGEVQRRLAEEFGVTPATINCVVLRKSWSHVE